MGSGSGKRLDSLDVFRGVTVAGMILVNNPGDWGHIYSPLEHSDWNGCTPADLIFPFFLFIMGVSASFALKKDHADKGPQVIKVVKRTVIILLLGLFISLFPKIFYEPLVSLKTFRVMGILPRIALVYLAVGLIFLNTTVKTQVYSVAGILVFYWIAMTCIPVPGTGYPNLEKETNLGAWVDRSVFGTAHLWINSVTWDPEGLLGTLPAIATGLIGLLTGQFLRGKQQDESTKVAWMFVSGTLITIAGLAWGLQFPINKSLWTSSYVLYTGGLAIIGFALCYWLIDINGYKRFTTPFVVYGVNAITVYFFSQNIARSMNMIVVKTARGPASLKDAIYLHYFAPNFSPLNASLAFGLAFILIWLAILWWMYTKNIIIKV